MGYHSQALAASGRAKGPCTHGRGDWGGGTHQSANPGPSSQYGVAIPTELRRLLRQNCTDWVLHDRGLIPTKGLILIFTATATPSPSCPKGSWDCAPGRPCTITGPRRRRDLNLRYPSFSTFVVRIHSKFSYYFTFILPVCTVHKITTIINSTPPLLNLPYLLTMLLLTCFALESTVLRKNTH